METLKAINTRRSVREYLDKKIPEGIIEEILKCAMDAPSARNKQPWHFVVMDDPKLLKEIPSFSPHAQMCKDAPLAILICGDMNLEQEDYWIQDCSAATQNLLLAIHEKGLGAVWTGVYPRLERIKGFKDLLKLPLEIIPLALIVIGYPKKPLPQKENFKKERIHKNSW
jgi:nitroreductase